MPPSLNGSCRCEHISLMAKTLSKSQLVWAKVEAKQQRRKHQIDKHNMGSPPMKIDLFNLNRNNKFVLRLQLFCSWKRNFLSPCFSREKKLLTKSPQNNREKQQCSFMCYIFWRTQPTCIQGKLLWWKKIVVKINK